MQESYKARKRKHIKKKSEARKKDKDWNFAYLPKLTGDMYCKYCFKRQTNYCQLFLFLNYYRT